MFKNISLAPGVWRRSRTGTMPFPPKSLRSARRVLHALTLALLTSAAALAESMPFHTIDGFEGGEVYDLATDRNGALYVAGTREVSGVSTALLRVSTDCGQTWVDHYDTSDIPVYNAVATARCREHPNFTLPFEDTVVVAGGSLSMGTWKVVRNINGQGWEVIDEFFDENIALGGSNPEVSSAAIDSDGNVYIAGVAKFPVTTSSRKGSRELKMGWLVRRIGRDGTKTTIRFSDSVTGYYPVPYAMTCVGTTVYVAGNGGDRWQVRRSDDGGASWSLVDNFRFDESQRSEAFGMTAAPDGSIYVVGRVWQASGKGKTATLKSRWFARGGDGSAGSFQPVANFMSGAFTGIALDVACDIYGNLHVTGSITEVNGVETYQWVTRTRGVGEAEWFTTGLVEGGAIAIEADPFGNIYSAGYAPPAGCVIQIQQSAAAESVVE